MTTVPSSTHIWGSKSYTSTYEGLYGQGTSTVSSVSKELLSNLTYKEDFWLVNGDQKLYSKWPGSRASPEAGSNHRPQVYTFLRTVTSSTLFPTVPRADNA